jgi:hypothetical protein
MFASIRQASAAIQDLRQGVDELCKLIGTHLQQTSDAGSLADRLDALEISRATWEAEIEAEFTRAETKFKSARNAEERARALGKKRDYQADIFGDESEEEQAGIPPVNVGISPEEGLQPLYMDVEKPNPKALALRYKYA